ncbi:MAG: DUF899 family protein [Chloroflexota bacterium]
MKYTRLPNQSADDIQRREALRVAEVELMRHTERVAAMRRELPTGPTVEDYLFLEGPRDLAAGDDPVTEVRLSELFTGSNRTLVMYQFMYGKRQTSPCPMCTMWIDSYDGAAQHLAQNVDFVIAAAAEPVLLRQHARNRGWRNLRLLSCGESTFKYDLGSEDAEGNQDSTISVFTRDESGQVRHFYSGHPRMADDISERGIDLLTPVWNLLDLTPQGRGDWYPELAYAPPAGSGDRTSSRVEPR